jgi:hypothetical protein
MSAREPFGDALLVSNKAFTPEVGVMERTRAGLFPKHDVLLLHASKLRGSGEALD